MKVDRHTLTLNDGSEFLFYTSTKYQPYDTMYDHAAKFSAVTESVHTEHGVDLNTAYFNSVKKNGLYLTRQKYTLSYPNKSNEAFASKYTDFLNKVINSRNNTPPASH